MTLGTSVTMPVGHVSAGIVWIVYAKCSTHCLIDIQLIKSSISIAVVLAVLIGSFTHAEFVASC